MWILRAVDAVMLQLVSQKYSIWRELLYIYELPLAAGSKGKEF